MCLFVRTVLICLNHIDGSLFVVIRHPGNVSLLIIGWNLIVALRPCTTGIFLPTVIFVQRNFYAFRICRVHNQMLILSGVVFCQSIGVRNVIHQILDFLCCHFLCRCLSQIRWKINPFIQFQIIRQKLLSSFFRITIHICQITIRIIIVIHRLQTICHAICQSSGISCISGKTKGCFIIIIGTIAFHTISI